jgi:hypothetical protein
MPIGNYNPAALAAVFSAQKNSGRLGRIMRLVMTPRTCQLNYYKAHYDAEEYEDRIVAWDGSRVLRPEDRPSVMSQTSPAHDLSDVGRFDAVPLGHRRPDFEGHAVREIVNGFSDLLFGDEMAPRIEVVGDEAATEWLTAMVKATSFWSRWSEARDDAGAMGSAAITFKFVDGALEIEVHDPRWCEPTIVNQASGECAALEIRWIYPVDEMNPQTGNTETAWKWYRRTITTTTDITYLPTPADPDVEPVWEPDPALTFEHGLGEFPGVWIQNTRARGRIDGDPDCKGLLGDAEVQDQLMTQASVGARNNADPTLHLGVSDQALTTIRKGSNHAIRTEPTDRVAYVEMAGSGVKVAMEVADAIDQRMLRAANFVRLADRVSGPMTATEVLRVCGPMYNSVRRRRRHWTPAITLFTERIIRATRRLTQPAAPVAQVQPDGSTILVQSVATVAIPLPPSLMTGQIEDPSLAAAAFTINVKWPPVVAPTASDAQAAAQAAAAARGSRIIDRRSAVRYVAPAFGIDDVDAVMAELEAEDQAAAAALESELLAGQPAAPTTDTTPAADPAAAAAAAPTDTAGGIAPTTEPAKDAMTGVQITALVMLAEKAYSGALPRAVVMAQARIAFPAAFIEDLEAAIPEPSPAAVAAAQAQAAALAAPPAPPPPPPAGGTGVP